MTSQTRPDSLTRFLDHLARSLPEDGGRAGFLKLTLSGPTEEGPEIPRRLDWKLVILKSGLALSCVHHYPRRDETKNFPLAEALQIIRNQLGTHMRCADLQTSSGLHSLRFDRKGAPHLVSKRLGPGPAESAPATPAAPVLTHDRLKERLLEPTAPWLRLLGVTDENGIIPRMQDKFRQIDRFVRIIDDLVEESRLLKSTPEASQSTQNPTPDPLQVVDMGCGKAYLTFALHAHLSARTLTHTTGVEIRADLVESSNKNATQAGFTQTTPGSSTLTFQQGTIQNWHPKSQKAEATSPLLPGQQSEASSPSLPGQRSEAVPSNEKNDLRARRRPESKDEPEMRSGACHSAREHRNEGEDAAIRDAPGPGQRSEAASPPLPGQRSEAVPPLPGQRSEAVPSNNKNDLRARRRLEDKEEAEASSGVWPSPHEQRSEADDAVFKDAPGPVGLLVALHACDTATDDALLAGLESGARIMVCSPCCHKQVRKDMKSPAPAALMTRFGILEERLAEMITDSVRALVLEAYGYKVKVFEFISSEHTGKNLMITAVKSGKSGAQPDPGPARPEKLTQARELLAAYGVTRHYLMEKIGEPLQD